MRLKTTTWDYLLLLPAKEGPNSTLALYDMPEIPNLPKKSDFFQFKLPTLLAAKCSASCIADDESAAASPVSVYL